MKNMKNITILGLLAAFTAFAQVNTLTQTTTSAAVGANDRQISVTSATGITAPSFPNQTAGTQLFVVDPGQIAGEVMNVTAVSGTTITVTRNAGRSKPHVNGSMVLAGLPQWFYKTNPVGSCTTASIYVTPYVNVLTGEQWLCSTITLGWIPGFGNPAGGLQNGQVNALVASAAGATAVKSPFLHVTGTNAITSFTMGIGWNANGFCTYPDGAFTGVAGNNIAKAFTAVADRILCFYWDATNSKFTPSY